MTLSSNQMHRAALLLMVVALSGCYTYTRVPGPTPLGTDVEVELTDAGAAGLAPLIGPQVVSIRGRTTSVAEDTVRLEVASILKRRGVDELWSREPLALSRAHISTVSARRFSWARTSLLTLTVIGGALLIGSAVDLGVGGESGTGKVPGQ